MRRSREAGGKETAHKQCTILPASADRGAVDGGDYSTSLELYYHLFNARMHMTKTRQDPRWKGNNREESEQLEPLHFIPSLARVDTFANY
jgi:hypothetical protein